MSEYFFRRYRNGAHMAEGVRITQAQTLDEACLLASKIAARYKDGTTLVYELDDETYARAELAAERADKEYWRGEQENVWDRCRAAEAERDALRELLREAREYTGYAAFYGDRIEADHAVDLCARINAAMNKGGGDE